ncbi:hypothetical protein PAPYR_3383 [Paratrimastix pyriformis]|uniref:Uncharacterized protein n=1 Tax=Paratrimastix pyriformis TaxID=342808 RepID=A0ABQ8UQ05_9EUKA|nr:hypothetical protein PAPYR_3383 [Paratrimastix pyriformis]
MSELEQELQELHIADAVRSFYLSKNEERKTWLTLNPSTPFPDEQLFRTYETWAAVARDAVHWANEHPTLSLADFRTQYPNIVELRSVLRQHLATSQKRTIGPGDSPSRRRARQQGLLGDQDPMASRYETPLTLTSLKLGATVAACEGRVTSWSDFTALFHALESHMADVAPVPARK